MPPVKMFKYGASWFLDDIFCAPREQLAARKIEHKRSQLSIDSGMDVDEKLQMCQFLRKGVECSIQCYVAHCGVPHIIH